MLQSITNLHIHHPPQSSILTDSSPLLKPTLSHSLTFLTKPTSLPSLSSSSRQNTQLLTATQDDGPIELSPDTPSIFATDDNPTPLQVSTSVLLTGAISIFLFRSVRRRIRRAKELRVRSSGVKKTLKEEALDSLKEVGSISVGSKGQPSPVQTFLGGISAGVIALILYKFTTTVEASLNQQNISENFSVRQITITVRTIINGICYLATFVFGLNGIGLVLYSGQLALNSLFEGSTGNDEETNDEKQASSSSLSSESPNTTENNDTDETK